MNYRSIRDLTICLENNFWRVREADLIVGIPRSGMLVANLLALYLHKPVVTLDEFLSGVVPHASRRLDTTGFKSQKIIVIDDTCLTGREITNARHKIEGLGLKEKVSFGCVYATDSSKKFIDFWFESLPYPRLFEWNIFHHSLLSKACMDMDGCICRNPTEGENDDDAQYSQFLKAAEPLFLPSTRIGAIVTCRLEKYRALTCEWLKVHGVIYDSLVMMPCATKAERIAKGHATFKSEIYLSGPYKLFLESCPNQAKDIFKKTGRPVFCVQTKVMFLP